MLPVPQRVNKVFAFALMDIVEQINRHVFEDTYPLD